MKEEDKGIIKVTVRDKADKYTPIANARVQVQQSVPSGGKAKRGFEAPTAAPPSSAPIETKTTDQNGHAEFTLNPGSYQVSLVDSLVALGPKENPKYTEVTDCGCSDLCFEVPVGFEATVAICRDDATSKACPNVIEAGTSIQVSASTKAQASDFLNPVEFSFSSSQGFFKKIGEQEAILETGGFKGPAKITSTLKATGSALAPSLTVSENLNFTQQPPQPISGDISVRLNRTATTPTPDMALWTYIRMATGAISFANYKKFMDDVLCGREQVEPRTRRRRHLGLALPFPGVEPYTLVKRATEVFLMTHCGVKGDNGFGFYNLDLDNTALLEEQNRYGRNIDGSALNELWQTQYLVDYANGGNGSQPHKTLPYLALIRSRLGEVPIKDDDGSTSSSELANCFGILRSKLENPCLLELIWSYWHEEGMLVQTMKAISLRFQNRTSGETDPLMRFDIDPLRPLGNLLWGYIQDEQHRLSVMRRNLEYRHHYDMPLQGRAAPVMRAADVRSKFLEAFHNLLHTCAIFFKADDDTTKIADGFPVMNAIREVHLLLAEGAHNQFGDLPSTARQEMLMEQWILARPEMREFLGGRIMVPYSEVWMDRVDTVKRLEGWTDNTITDFHDLAVFGEQLLLSIRYGNWSDVHDPAHAANWARYWRPEIQGYLHSYRSVTGVDLNVEVTDTRAHDRYAPPSTHLQRRLELQRAQRPSDGGAPGLPKRQRNGGSGGVRVAVTRPAGTRAEMEVSEDF